MALSKFQLIIVGGVGLAWLAASLVWLEFNQSSNHHDWISRPAKINGVNLDLWLADTAAKRQAGLSNWPELPANQGMIFIFSEPDYYYFWMLDMNLALDLIWLNRDYTIIDITPNLTPDTYPAKFTSSQPAWYVIEVPAGFSQIHNLELGHQLKWLD